jgi:hypothetical protein
MYRVNLKLNSLLDGAKVKDGCLGSEPPARNSRRDEEGSPRRCAKSISCRQLLEIY